MPIAASRRPAAGTWTLALAAMLVVAAFLHYAPTLAYGFVYDDYHFARPYDRAELAAVWHGSWDPQGIERPFYRPLTIAFYAARFHLLRFDAHAYHALSVALFALAGSIGLAFVSRVARSRLTMVWFAAYWVAQPNFAISLVAWLTNQMHLLQTIVCLTALWWWARIKARGAVWWLPLLALQAVALLIKEDGVMLLPAILVGHALYRLTVERELRWPPPAIVLGGVVLIGALLLVRHAALGGLGGYGAPPDGAAMWANLLKGPLRVLLQRPAPRGAPLYAYAHAWIATILLPLGLIVAWRTHRREIVFLILFGVLLVGLFDLPFALVSKAEQYHLLATGTVLAFAAATDVVVRTVLRARHASVWQAAPRIGALLLTAPLVPILIWLAVMQRDARAIAALYSPFGVETRRTDAFVTEWAAVPSEIRTWLTVKGVPPNTGDLAHDLPCLAFGLYAPEKDFEHRVYRWTSGAVRLFVNDDATSVTFGLRPLLIERPKRPFGVRVLVDGRPVAEQTLATEQEAAFSVGLPRTRRLLRRMRRVDVLIDHTWTPGPNDSRALGVKLYDLICSAHAPTTPAPRTPSR